MAAEEPRVPGYDVVMPAGRDTPRAGWLVRDAAGRLGLLRHVPGATVDALESLRALSHPHLPEVLDVLVGQAGPYLVTRAVEGQTLAEKVERHGPLGKAEVAQLWHGLADALAAAHAAGVVHAQISPALVVFDTAGRAVLADAAVAGAGQVLRSFEAPEGAGSAASDVWALARALAWAGGDDARVVAALGDALHADPQRRPAAREFALARFLLGREQESAPPGMPAVGAAVADTVRSTLRQEPAGATSARPGRGVGRWLLPTLLAGGAATLGLWGMGELRGEPVEAACQDPARAVVDILERRDAAVRSGEPDLDLYAAGSAARNAERRLFAAADFAGAAGYTTTVHAVDVLAANSATATVRVEFSQSAFVEYGTSGELRTVGEQEPACVRAVLQCGAAWQVQELLPCTQTAAGRGE